MIDSLQHARAAVPKYVLIADHLRSLIKNGELTERIPSRSDLASSYRVNFKTVDKALAVLDEDRIVVRRKGLGVFVHPRHRGRTVKEFYFVFPGHKALTEDTNPGRFLLSNILDLVLTESHDQSLEARILPISPRNDDRVNWRLLQHLSSRDSAVFIGIQYWNVIRVLARRGCRCLILNDQPPEASLTEPGLPVMSFDVDYKAMMRDLADHVAARGGRHLALPRPASSPALQTDLWRACEERLARECARRGVRLTQLLVEEKELTAPRLAAALAAAGRSGPPVDAFFARSERLVRTAREAVDRDRSLNRDLELVCHNLFETWDAAREQSAAFRTPQARIVRTALTVVAESRFEAGVKLFRARLSTPRSREPGDAVDSKGDARE